MSKKGKKMTWNDVTYRQFGQLQELLKIENDEEKLIQIVQLFFGEDVIDLPLNEFMLKTKELDFLDTPIPSNVPPKKVAINGKKYYLDCLLGNITTAQYVDYTNHSKTNDINKMLSVFFIPEGHKYNDGYDMEEVFNDINDLPVTVVNDTAFFLGKHYSTFMRIFQRYSIKQLKRANLPKEVKKNLIKVVENSVDLVLSPLSSNSVK